MKKIYSVICFVLGASTLFAQMLITEKVTAPNTFVDPPHQSAILEVRSGSKGVLIPTAALTNLTDATTVQNPVEGSILFNTSTNATHPNIPTTRPALAVWDGNRWLFTYNKQNVDLDLDKVRNFIADNGSTVITISTFPTTAASFTYGESITSAWSVLINSANTAQQPYFEFDAQDAEQRLVIDVEGVAAINNDASGANFSYAIGVFVNDKLVSVQKYESNSLNGACMFQKFNIRAILDEGTNNTILNQNANLPYNVKLAVRALPKNSGFANFDRLVFGNVAGNRVGTSTGCGNLNEGTARSYMNILTIERKHIN